MVPLRAGVKRKMEFHQHALHLMLHQSDAARFMMRGGKADQAVAHRLDLIESARARRLVQDRRPLTPRSGLAGGVTAQVPQATKPR